MVSINGAAVASQIICGKCNDLCNWPFTCQAVPVHKFWAGVGFFFFLFFGVFVLFCLGFFNTYFHTEIRNCSDFSSVLNFFFYWKPRQNKPKTLISMSWFQCQKLWQMTNWGKSKVLYMFLLLCLPGLRNMVFNSPQEKEKILKQRHSVYCQIKKNTLRQYKSLLIPNWQSVGDLNLTYCFNSTISSFFSICSMG